LGHGLGSHAGHWLINSDDGHLEPMMDSNDKRSSNKPFKKPCNNLGFLLANLGYDVWLLNWRGSRYSSKHRRLSPKDTKFWDFSMDEMVEHDLPCFIDTILEKTGKPTLGYIGNGQGANIMFAMLSTRFDMNEKIKPFVAMAPTLKLSNASKIPIPVLKLRIPPPDFIKIPMLRVVNYVLSSSPGEVPLLCLVSRVTRLLGSGNSFQYYMNRIMHMVSNSIHDSDINEERLSVYACQADLHISKKNLAQLIQLNIYDEFSRFDYGDKHNEKSYGNVDPPLYDIRTITNRTIAMIYSLNDQLTTEADMDFISNSLRVPMLEEFQVPDPKWSHADFVYGRKLGAVINSKIIDILKKADHIPIEEVCMKL